VSNPERLVLAKEQQFSVRPVHAANVGPNLLSSCELRAKHFAMNYGRSRVCSRNRPYLQRLRLVPYRLHRLGYDLALRHVRPIILLNTINIVDFSPLSSLAAET